MRLSIKKVHEIFRSAHPFGPEDPGCCPNILPFGKPFTAPPRRGLSKCFVKICGPMGPARSGRSAFPEDKIRVTRFPGASRVLFHFFEKKFHQMSPCGNIITYLMGVVFSERIHVAPSFTHNLRTGNKNLVSYVIACACLGVMFKRDRFYPESIRLWL